MAVMRPTKSNYRVICNCQMHRGRKRAQRVAAAALSHLRRRSVALIVGVPLAFGALGIPTEAMNLSLNVSAPSFRAFTQRNVRVEKSSFNFPAPPPMAVTLDAMKEDYFRREIPYGEIIFREAQRNDLPPELVAAVIESESDFRVRLVSNKNAQGLMQIIPETGRLFGCENPFNPAQNIAAGTKYLRYLMDRFGDQHMALAAYNAGEGNVERFGGIPPFAETTEYLQRVNYRTKSYRQRIHNRYVAAIRMRGTVLQ
jgi:soluble lytic murein transglycosylase-like protein